MLEHLLTKKSIVTLIGIGITIAVTVRHMLFIKRNRTITEISRLHPYVKYHKPPRYKEYS